MRQMGLVCDILLSVVAVHIGGQHMLAQSEKLYCGVNIQNGRVSHETNTGCRLQFPCPTDVNGQVLYKLSCQSSQENLLVHGCSGTCPDMKTEFYSNCYDSKWSPSLESACDITTTASVPTTRRPPDDSESTDGTNPSRSLLWTVVVGLVLVAIMVVVCGMAVRASRSRRAMQSMRSQRTGGSPMMIYTVALECGAGQALRDSIRSYMQQSGGQPEITQCSLDVVKPPSYDEVVSWDTGDTVGVDIPDSPPPYSEITKSTSKDLGTT